MCHEGFSKTGIFELFYLLAKYLLGPFLTSLLKCFSKSASKQLFERVQLSFYKLYFVLVATIKFQDVSYFNFFPFTIHLSIAPPPSFSPFSSFPLPFNLLKDRQFPSNQ